MSESATHAFDKLQLATTSALIVVLPDFTKEFVVETDALGDDIGAVLEGKPIVFFFETGKCEFLSIKDMLDTIRKCEILKNRKEDTCRDLNKSTD